MKRAFTLLEILIVVAILAVVALLLLPVFSRVREDSPRHSNCSSNLRQIGLGVIQYVQDYNGKFPPVRVTPTSGWADALYPYTKSLALFQCDKASNGSTGTLTTDYFLNRYLSRVSASRVKYPTTTLLLGDGADNAPTWNSWIALPADAFTNSSSPARRHVGGAEYCFADGHVKWIKPEDLSHHAKWSLR